MGFGERQQQAATFIKIVDEQIWRTESLAKRVLVVPYGYETHIPKEIREQLRYLRTLTSKHVRFTPDFFVLDRDQPERMYLLEYKVTQTPLYSSRRINSIRRAADEPTLQWVDIGQMEADAYDNYVSLQKMGIRVAVLNYCAYHKRLLLCDFIEKIRDLGRFKVKLRTQTGSGTPYVNFDCNTMRSLYVFIREEHGVEMDKGIYQGAAKALRAKLPVKHHEGSPLHPSKRRKK